jgi:hypothetical protein
MGNGLRLDDGAAASGLCPYSEETVAGCRHYRPISTHGDFPEAAHCAEAAVLSGANHIRHTICRRRTHRHELRHTPQVDGARINLTAPSARRGVLPSTASP